MYLLCVCMHVCLCALRVHITFLCVCVPACRACAHSVCVCEFLCASLVFAGMELLCSCVFLDIVILVRLEFSFEFYLPSSKLFLVIMVWWYRPQTLHPGCWSTCWLPVSKTPWPHLQTKQKHCAALGAKFKCNCVSLNKLPSLWATASSAIR